MLLLTGVSVKVIQNQNYHVITPCTATQINPTKLLTNVHTIYRRINKKGSPNFLARYKYGNKQEKGIRILHVHEGFFKYKI